MHPVVNFSLRYNLRTIPNDFWKRVLEDEQLRDCTDLEKLLAGCEIIAAVDDIDELLAA